MERVILFDGRCGFCDKSVQFILDNDPHGFFKFAPLQSDTGKQLLRKFSVPKNIDSLVLIEGGACYFKSSAALRISRHLKRPWRWLYWLLVIPKPVRDFFYDLLAKNRYQWFGMNESCQVPGPTGVDSFDLNKLRNAGRDPTPASTGRDLSTRSTKKARGCSGLA